MKSSTRRTNARVTAGVGARWPAEVDRLVRNGRCCDPCSHSAPDEPRHSDGDPATQPTPKEKTKFANL